LGSDIVDCDDTDPDSTTTATDADCDGVLTEYDCDDLSDAIAIDTRTDADCDGFSTDSDCDDDDSTLGSLDDCDGDGIAADEDCDDTDSTTVDDMDCDGVATDADCNDDDSTLLAIGDCDDDGIATDDDCDDYDSTLRALGDCDDDGFDTDADCDDTDPDSTTIDLDGDCDGREDYEADHGGTMIKIEAQTFEMGCTAGMSSCASDESPAHFVTLTNDFYIGQTEVTQGEYAGMMGTNPSHFSSCGSDCPVEQVNWHESAAFANAVSDSEDLEQCYTCTGSGSSTVCSIAVEPYSCGGYRLPTEAEWEAAARCGEDTLYPGSTVINDVAWYSGSLGATTHTVATKASNACGLYDMSGNVWEWIQDWYSSSYYSSSPGTDPSGATSGDLRVSRGGGWNGAPASARVAYRDWAHPTYRDFNYGLRLLRTSP
jgi:formylglycine-generating enzyme required for sulfatase activity